MSVFGMLRQLTRQRVGNAGNKLRCRRFGKGNDQNPRQIAASVRRTDTLDDAACQNRSFSRARRRGNRYRASAGKNRIPLRRRPIHSPHVVLLFVFILAYFTLYSFA